MFIKNIHRVLCKTINTFDAILLGLDKVIYAGILAFLFKDHPWILIPVLAIAAQWYFRLYQIITPPMRGIGAVLGLSGLTLNVLSQNNTQPLDDYGHKLVVLPIGDNVMMWAVSGYGVMCTLAASKLEPQTFDAFLQHEISHLKRNDPMRRLGVRTLV